MLWDCGDVWEFVQEIAFGILGWGENCADFMGIFCKRIHGWEWFVVVRFVGKGVESSVEKWGNDGVLLGGLAVEKLVGGCFGLRCWVLVTGCGSVLVGLWAWLW